MPLAEFYRLEKSPAFNAECLLFNRLVKESLSELNDKVDVIIVSSAWLIYFYGNDILNGVENYSGVPLISNIRLSVDGDNQILPVEREEIFFQYFNDLFSQLSTSSKKVIVVGPKPPSIARFDNKFSIFNPKLITTDQYFNSIASFSQVFNDVLSLHQISSIDLASELCGESVCEVIRNDKLLYSDQTHFSHYGQSTVIAPLLDELLR